MKSVVFIFISIIIIILISGCKTQETSELMIVNTKTPDQPVSSVPFIIPEVQDANADDIKKIDVYNDSTPPDSITRSYTSKKELSELLIKLKNVRLTKDIGENISNTPAPGDWYRYVIYYTNGSSITLSFAGNMVDFGQDYYEYKCG
jgi:hypothetical protein